MSVAATIIVFEYNVRFTQTGPTLKVCLHMNIPTIPPSDTERWVEFQAEELAAIMVDTLTDVRAAEDIVPSLFANCFIPRLMAALAARGDIPPTLI